MIKVFGYTLVFFVVFFWFSTPMYAETKPSISINGGARSTSSERVTLDIVLPKRAERMRIANNSRDLATVRWETAKERWEAWYLPKKSAVHRVYIQFELQDGSVSNIYSDSIDLQLGPLDGVHLTINEGDAVTESRRVTLSIGIPPGARRMRVSNDVDIAEADWRSLSHTLFWTLVEGAGNRTVYLQFEYRDGRLSNIFQDDIRLIQPMNIKVGVTINRGVEETFTKDVVLSLSYSHGIKEVRVSNDADFGSQKWQAPDHLIPWKLTDGVGKKTVYVQFKDLNDHVQTVNDTITLQEVRQQPETTGDSGATIRRIPAHSLVKGPGPGVFYVGEDGKLHAFDNSTIFYSWYTNFKDLKFISGAEIAQYEYGNPVCVRAGTWLIQFIGLPEIYSVEPGCRLRPLRSEVEAFIVYGSAWKERVMQLPEGRRTMYTIKRLSVADSELGVVDADGDGVDAPTENSIGSLDNRTDTDGDKLSDFEEIYWWFTSPVTRDTDADGMNDGDEILQLRSPNGDEAITAIAENTYFYPAGAVFRHNNRRYYYNAPTEGPLYMGWRTSDNRFESNQFQERFIIQPAVQILFSTKVRALAQAVPQIVYPTKRVNSTLLPL